MAGSTGILWLIEKIVVFRVRDDRRGFGNRLSLRAFADSVKNGHSVRESCNSAGTEYEERDRNDVVDFFAHRLHHEMAHASDASATSEATGRESVRADTAGADRALPA
jgi:hypothetical protein